MIWIILVLGLVLRLLSISQSFWLDEATSATVARDFSFRELITKFSPNDFHPPLYYLVLKAWTILFGVSEVSTRLLSILFALGTIFVVYKLVKLVSNHQSLVTARLSALLIASAPLHIYYSQEARMYSMSTFLVSLLIYFFVKTLKKGRVGSWVFFAITLALLGLTDYLPLLILPALWIYGYISKQKSTWWFNFAASHIILIISYLWWWPTLSRQLFGGLGVSTSLPGWWNVLGKTSFKEIFLVPVKFMIGRISVENKWLYGFIVGTIGLLFSYLLRQALKTIALMNKPVNVVWFWLIIPVFLAALIGLKIPVFTYFRFLFVLPAFYILVSIGLANIKEKFFPLFLMAALGVNIIFSGMYLFSPKFHREDWRGLVAALKLKDKAVAVFPAQSQREAFLYYGGKDNLVEVENLNEGFGEVWLLRYVTEITDPQDSARKRIEELGYNKTSEENYNGVLVWKYAHSN